MRNATPFKTDYSGTVVYDQAPAQRACGVQVIAAWWILFASVPNPFGAESSGADSVLLLLTDDAKGKVNQTSASCIGYLYAYV